VVVLISYLLRSSVANVANFENVLMFCGRVVNLKLFILSHVF